MPKNPPSATTHLPVYPTLAEVHAMLAACPSERDRLLIQLMWFTGGRVSEVVRIRVGDITSRGVQMLNEKQGRYEKLPDGTRRYVKVYAQKHVFLPDEFLERLREVTKDAPAQQFIVGPLAARPTDAPLCRQQAWRIVTGAARKAGIFKQRWRDGKIRAAWCHTLRHGHAINLLLQGVPITVVQRQLGHASLVNTQWYTQIADPHLEGLVNKVKW